MSLPMSKLAKLGICNSSPIISLDRIGRINLLDGHFDRLLAPDLVATEIGWLPPFVAQSSVPLDVPGIDLPASIHPGESSVIALARSFPEALLVVDDRPAREFARKLGFRVIGALGLIVECKRLGRVGQVGPVLDELRDGKFRISDSVYQHILHLAGEAA